MSIKKISNHDSRSISILFYKFEENSLYILQKNTNQYKDIGEYWIEQIHLIHF